MVSRHLRQPRLGTHVRTRRLTLPPPSAAGPPCRHAGRPVRRLSRRRGRTRALFDTIESTADGDPYVITVWAAFACTAAALAGDPAQALRTAAQGSALDPEFSFVFLGSYQRLAMCWARAVTGEDPAGAATEAQRLITAALADPPRSGLATWYGLLAEMWLAAGRSDEASAALDQADLALDTYGQRYAESLLLIIRARVLQARDEPDATVRAVAERARALCDEREAHLFARRVEELMSGLPEA
ncbi:hypothetical protein [Streptomyces sp. NPDC101776]|uniref:hypothetical protein n=1 Tax=Streptomyces sp. NPDC101776 TaxID=3366146 RepID=UPI0038228E0F